MMKLFCDWCGREINAAAWIETYSRIRVDSFMCMYKTQDIEEHVNISTLSSTLCSLCKALLDRAIETSKVAAEWALNDKREANANDC